MLDINDNKPVFDNASSEISASVPTTAEYGHPVTQVQVRINNLSLPIRLDGINPKAAPFITEYSFYAH